MRENASDDSKKGFFQTLFRAKRARKGETHSLEQVSGCSIDDDGKAELPASAPLLLSPRAKEYGTWQGMGSGQANWPGGRAADGGASESLPLVYMTSCETLHHT